MRVSGLRYTEMSPGTVYLRTEQRPHLPPGVARVAVTACGICGSDLHMFRGMPLPKGLVYPVRPGHEVAGRVVEVCEPSCGIRNGDDVVLHIYDPCGDCEFCLSGRENRCPQARVLGIHTPGGLADEVLWPTRRMLPVPKMMPEHAALLPDAVASAYHALELAGVNQAETLCVMGAGGVGTHVLQIARARWPALSLAAVVRTSATAERLSATGVFAVAGDFEGSRAVNRELGKVDVVIDFSGSAAAAAHALRMLRPGGRLVLGSVSEEPLTLGTPVTTVSVRELQILGSYGSTLRELKAVVALAADGLLDLVASVTHTFPLAKVEDAFRLAACRPPGFVRAVIKPESRTS